MTSVVTTVQGMSVDISTSECTDVNITPLPDMASLNCLTKNVSVTGGSSSEIDITTLCSTSKEFRLGLSDAGTMSIGGFWKIDDPAHIALREADEDHLPRLIVVTFSDGSSWKCLALVSQRNWSAAVDGVVEATYSLRLTGQPVETVATPVVPTP
jgi:hypothetical protein